MIATVSTVTTNGAMSGSSATRRRSKRDTTQHRRGNEGPVGEKRGAVHPLRTQRKLRLEVGRLHGVEEPPGATLASNRNDGETTDVRPHVSGCLAAQRRVTERIVNSSTCGRSAQSCPDN